MRAKAMPDPNAGAEAREKTRRYEAALASTRLSFMPDVEVTCPTCKGARYNQETLDVTYHEQNIADVLADIQRLLDCLGRLVEAGHTVVVIEHNLDVVKTADYVVDLGPEGGHNGGEVVARGPPEQIVRSKRSHTGRFLRRYLEAATKR